MSNTIYSIEQVLSAMSETKHLLLDSKCLMANGKTTHKLLNLAEKFKSEILNATCFLPIDSDYKQRYYHIINELVFSPVCQYCSVNKTEFKKVNKGYKLTCSKECHHLLKSQRGGKTKSENGVAKEAYVKRTKTLLDGNPNALSDIGKKAAQTFKKRDDYQEIIDRAGKLKSETILENGLSIAQNARFKQIEVLKNTILNDGSTAFENVGNNIREALLSSEKFKESIEVNRAKWHMIEENGKTKGQNNATKGVAQCRITKEDNGTMIPLSQKNDFELYYYYVWKITEKQNLSSLVNFELRGNHAANINAYHLDHKFSIFEGFRNNIPPYIIGGINNLEFLPWRENIVKSIKCSVSLEELIL